MTEFDRYGPARDDCTCRRCRHDDGAPVGSHDPRTCATCRRVAAGVRVTTETKPLLGISALGHNVYVFMRNGQKRLVPEHEVVTVIAEWLDTHDLVVNKDGYRVRYGVEEILPLDDDAQRPEEGTSEAPTSGPPHSEPHHSAGDAGATSVADGPEHTAAPSDEGEGA